MRQPLQFTFEQEAVLADSVGIALLVVLDTLTEYTTSVKPNLLDEGIDQYLGISWPRLQDWCDARLWKPPG